MKHTYYVSNALNDCTSDSIKDFYEDSFVVGEFETDQEAWDATIAIQEKHDEEAWKAIERRGDSEDDYDTAPSYTSHLFREPNEGEEPYECVQIML